MAPLLLELSSLEVEPVDIIIKAPEQERSLNTLVEEEVAALLTGEGVFTTNHHGDNCASCTKCAFCSPPVCVLCAFCS
jgi:hypothetical protein